MNTNRHIGFVNVAPNEYVVHTRFGRIVNQGLGRTFFCFPLIDSYITFPVTPNKINFYADNITIEKQGIGIDGFLIWSIEDGNKAYKKINTFNPQAIEDMSIQLIDICVSITRHAISNMSLDEVLTNRETLVDKLSSQLSNIIFDWGLKIEAIEIKEVRILSETLFESMQAPFRNQQLELAEHSRLDAKKSIENTTTDTNVAIRIRKAEQELQARAIEIDNIDKQKLIEHEFSIKENDRIMQEKLHILDNENKEKIQQKEFDKQQAIIDQEMVITLEESKRSIVKEQNQTEKYKAELEAEKELLIKDTEIALKDKDLQYISKEREAEIIFKRNLNEINNNLSQEALLKVLFNELGESLKNINFEKAQWYSMGDSTPMGTLPKTIVEIVSTLQSMGILKQNTAIEINPAET